MAFPNGMVPTTASVHPTALYEAFAAFAIATLLWQVRTRWQPFATVGVYALLTGAARFLIEFVRVNDPALFGLAQPQLWSLVLMALGAGALVVATRPTRGGPLSPGQISEPLHTAFSGDATASAPQVSATPRSHPGRK